MPSIERAFFTSSGAEATFFALRLARAATGRQKVIKFQGCYHGWHDAVAMNVISPAERVGARDPIGVGQSPEVVDATIVCRFNDAADVERAAEENRGEIAAIIVEPIPHNIGAVLPQPGFLEALREHLRPARDRADLRRGDHRLPACAGRLSGHLGRHARPDDARQGRRERVSAGRARRPRGPDGSDRGDGQPAGVRRRHVQRASGGRGRRAGDDREARERAGPRAHLPARGARSDGACRAVRGAGDPGRRVGIRVGVRDVLPRGRRSSATTTCCGTTSICSSGTGWS